MKIEVEVIGVRQDRVCPNAARAIGEWHTIGIVEGSQVCTTCLATPVNSNYVAVDQATFERVLEGLMEQEKSA